MIRGTEKNIRPFIKRILIEDGYQSKPGNTPQHAQYYISHAKNDEYHLNLTMDFCIKKHMNKITSLNLNSVKSLLSSVALHVEFINDSSELKKFLISSASEKVNYLNKFKDKNDKFVNGIPMVFSTEDFFNYISISQNNPSSNREISIPTTVTKKYGKNLSKSNKNPNFLACVYFFTIDQEVIDDRSIGAEIVFSGGTLSTSSGYFVISDKFSFNGLELPLTKVDLTTSRRFLNPITGENINPNAETNRNQQVNLLYGAPGDIWAGPVHIHPIANATNINFGKGRIMAGAAHSNGIPHPYLKYIAKESRKIIDFRNSMSFKDAFSYKFGIDRRLSTMQRVYYTQQKNINLPIDQRINKAVFSDCKYSIRSISRQRGSENIKTKDNLILFFALDKKELLFQTTKIPSFLRALNSINTSAYLSLAASINITHFEIIRVEKKSGQAQSLLIGDNDNSFNDFNFVNQLGKNISKGFSLVNKTNEIYLEGAEVNNQINLYEFTDGEIDSYRDNNEYYYKIKFKFRDPIIDYVSDKLNILNRVIHDLDELLYKISATMIDPATGVRVKVFDKYKKQLNTNFVEQSILSSPNSPIPLSFSFNAQTQLPQSVASMISANNDMASYFSTLNTLFNKDAISIDADGFIQFVKNSLMLSNTTPMLIEKNRSLFALLRDRTEKLLKLFSVEKMTKKSSGFTSKDYLKSSRSSKAISDGVITEYEYSFKQSIDLSKTGDHFNWIEEARSEINTGFKTISGNTYKGLVENKNITNYLTELGKNDPQVSNLFDYSFLPYSSPAVLDLHKTDKVNLSLNHLQTLRKKIMQNTSDNPESVLIPELLATFGIKFLHPKSNLQSYITDQVNYAEGEVPINNGFEDNFGSEFSSLYKTSDVKSLSFGATSSPDTAWAGNSYEHYPSNAAMSILNLTTTNVFDRKNIEYLFNTHKELSKNISLPYSTKLFSSEVMSNRNTANTIIKDVISNLFDNNGLIKYEKYSYYSYLLNIFAKVYYLKGFGINQQNDINNNRFSAIPITNNFFIKRMMWEPLTAGLINSIPANRAIVCKAVLFQGTEAEHLIDFSVVDMYKKYYNYNQIFLIKQSGASRASTQPAGSIIDLSAPPVEIQIVPYGSITRELLDKQVRNMHTIMQEEESMERKRDPKEERAIKKSNSPHSVSSTTYIKEMRR